MNKEELKQEAEEWLNKWELCNKCENKVDCISNFSYCKKVVLQSYLASAEPREKRITTLEKENAELKEELKDANKKVVHLACNQNIDLKRKINKAKEIIKNLMVYAEIDCREYEKAYKEAEQFFKDCEVEK